MIASEAAPAWRSPSSPPWQPSRKHTVFVVAMLSLITAFLLAGTPATVATPVSNNDHVVFVSADIPAPCPGEKPGMCPD